MEINDTLIIPAGFDAKVMNSWIGKEEVIDSNSTDNTVIVQTQNHNTDKCRIIRFFLLNGKTEVSVDFDGSRREPISENLVFDLLVKYFK